MNQDPITDIVSEYRLLMDILYNIFYTPTVFVGKKSDMSKLNPVPPINALD